MATTTTTTTPGRAAATAIALLAEDNTNIKECHRSRSDCVKNYFIEIPYLRPHLWQQDDRKEIDWRQLVPYFTTKSHFG
jgi:hypothetical protein